MAQNQLQEARDFLSAAMQARPEYTEPLKTSVVLVNQAKSWKRLVVITDRLLKLDAANNSQAYVFNAIGNTRNFEAAEKSAREAERYDTQRRFPSTWQLLGSILAPRGDVAGAAEQYRKYLKWKPDAPDGNAIRAKLADLDKAAPAAPSPEPSDATFR